MTNPEYQIHASLDDAIEANPATARLKADPGTVYFLDSWLLENGREVFSAALDCIPAGTVHHVLADNYPRIVGSLKAQGCRVRHDSVLTLVSSWEDED